MAKNAPANESDPNSTGELSFEEALKRLESIVESMEGEELPLDQLLSKYEEGSKLSRICQAKLQQAELKIQQLEKTASGELAARNVNLETNNP